MTLEVEPRDKVLTAVLTYRHAIQAVFPNFCRLQRTLGIGQWRVVRLTVVPFKHHQVGKPE